ncbi:hypothetical protein [Azospira restricta]|uniref:Carboxypeptidase regulatory-like domain-containing protein n=1 Tax=Azospira restricta TaxID=404405 RepID=A0A974PW82_9RHOO|nr:hypothetical protein [Azospira restricta]QRJ62120.1 hypothetical protein IWH25_09875 [Azospira restricta]
MTSTRRLLTASAFLIAFAAPAAHAAEAAHPSFEASSELFELVGRLKDGRLTLTLDRWASNEPVAGARIEIDSNGRQLVAAAQPDGTYTVDAAPFAAAANYPLAITVTAGSDSDLLATDFVVAPAAAAPAIAAPSRSGLLAGGALIALAAAAYAFLRRRRASGEHA